MFSDHVTGGDRGDQCLAYASGSSSFAYPSYIDPLHTWVFYDKKTGEFVPRPESRISIVEVKEDFPSARLTLNKEQAKLRTELYGRSGGEVIGSGPYSHGGHHHGHGGHHGFYYPGGYRGQQQAPGASSSQQQQKQQQQKQQEESRHGRKSAEKSWRQFAKQHPTGSHGKGMARMGGGHIGGRGGGGGS
eukprot:gnl/TRDRNA2_/TRDRNA2_170624_c1_seq1.p1 gnl/TRDRNA2_/TRDRNA2_170624_c1~~gnl/TRDRNA2_/TRDRNA2_170624_c1_seq1.p1  ORF type:complete len:189 (+),score=29.79 gnl/TRDRNA2_/TRDRNA2_170624_c1_seq1:189-755(+)